MVDLLFTFSVVIGSASGAAASAGSLSTAASECGYAEKTLISETLTSLPSDGWLHYENGLGQEFYVDPDSTANESRLLIEDPSTYDFGEFDQLNESAAVLKTVSIQDGEASIAYRPVSRSVMEDIQDEAVYDLDEDQEQIARVSYTAEFGIVIVGPILTPDLPTLVLNTGPKQGGGDVNSSAFFEEVRTGKYDNGYMAASRYYEGMDSPMANLFTHQSYIDQLIPREQFTTAGEYYAIGNEWGYYMKTAAGSDDTMLSSLVAFDVEKKQLSFPNGPDDYEYIRVTPGFSRNYIYYESVDWLYNDSESTLTIANPMFTSRILNLPYEPNSSNGLENDSTVGFYIDTYGIDIYGTGPRGSFALADYYDNWAAVLRGIGTVIDAAVDLLDFANFGEMASKILSSAKSGIADETRIENLESYAESIRKSNTISISATGSNGGIYDYNSYRFPDYQTANAGIYRGETSGEDFVLDYGTKSYLNGNSFLVNNGATKETPIMLYDDDSYFDWMCQPRIYLTYNDALLLTTMDFDVYDDRSTANDQTAYEYIGHIYGTAVTPLVRYMTSSQISFGFYEDNVIEGYYGSLENAPTTSSTLPDGVVSIYFTALRSLDYRFILKGAIPGTVMEIRDATTREIVASATQGWQYETPYLSAIKPVPTSDWLSIDLTALTNSAYRIYIYYYDDFVDQSRFAPSSYPFELMFGKLDGSMSESGSFGYYTSRSYSGCGTFYDLNLSTDSRKGLYALKADPDSGNGSYNSTLRVFNGDYELVGSVEGEDASLEIPLLAESKYFIYVFNPRYYTSFKMEVGAYQMANAYAINPYSSFDYDRYMYSYWNANQTAFLPGQREDYTLAVWGTPYPNQTDPQISLDITYVSGRSLASIDNIFGTIYDISVPAETPLLLDFTVVSGGTSFTLYMEAFA